MHLDVVTLFRTQKVKFNRGLSPICPSNHFSLSLHNSIVAPIFLIEIVFILLIIYKSTLVTLFYRV